MKPITTPYRCRICGAATYRRVVHRGPDGAMTYSGLYRCGGCDLTFSDPAAWWDGRSANAPAPAEPVRVHDNPA